MPEPAEVLPERPTWNQDECFACKGSGHGFIWTGNDVDLGECSRCKGWAVIWRHTSSGLVCAYPGGPILWRETP